MPISVQFCTDSINILFLVCTLSSLLSSLSFLHFFWFFYSYRDWILFYYLSASAWWSRFGFWLFLIYYAAPWFFFSPLVCFACLSCWLLQIFLYFLINLVCFMLHVKCLIFQKIENFFFDCYTEETLISGLVIMCFAWSVFMFWL